MTTTMWSDPDVIRPEPDPEPATPNGWKEEVWAVEEQSPEWNAPAPRRPAETGVAVDLPANIPEEFWSARPIHQRIRAAAWRYGYSSDATFAATLARVSAMAHPDLRFDFGRGRGSLNTFVSLIGPSGAGKTGSVETAQDLILVPTYLADEDVFRDGVGLGSGEGMAEIYMGTAEIETGEYHTRGRNKGEPKTVRVRAQVRHNAFFYVDEGQTLTKLMKERQGTTVGASLRTAWTGGTLGQSNAREETTRVVKRGTYAMGMVIGFQPNVAQDLLADGGPGTPQRFLWISVLDPNIPDDEGPEVPPFRVPLCDGHGHAVTGLITCYPELRAELRHDYLERSRGARVVGELDAHAALMRCKLASLLAVLDGRLRVEPDDWELAGMLWATSCAVRDHTIAIGQRKAAADREVEMSLLEEREERAHLARVGATEKVVRVARLIADKVHDAGVSTRGEAKRHLTSRDRSAAETAIDHAVREGWIEPDGDRVLRPGKVRPA